MAEWSQTLGRSLRELASTQINVHIGPQSVVRCVEFLDSRVVEGSIVRYISCQETYQNGAI